MTGPDEAFAGAIARWLERQAVSEAQLTSFAFREGQADIEVPPSTSHRAIGRWIVAIVADPGSAATLRSLDASGTSMRELVATGAFGLEPGDRVAVAARVGALASCGLVSRQLESDRVALTELGLAALAVAEVAVPEATEPSMVGLGRP